MKIWTPFAQVWFESEDDSPHEIGDYFAEIDNFDDNISDFYEESDDDE